MLGPHSECPRCGHSSFEIFPKLFFCQKTRCKSCKQTLSLKRNAIMDLFLILFWNPFSMAGIFLLGGWKEAIAIYAFTSLAFVMTFSVRRHPKKGLHYG